MNLKFIDRAMAAYGEGMEDHDKARLQFFRELWGEMDVWAHGPVTAAKGYELPDDEELKNAFDEDRALFSWAPLSLNADRLTAIFRNLRLHVLESGILEPIDAESLASLGVERILSDPEALERAAKDPEGFVGVFCDRAVDAGATTAAARIAAMLMILVLRVEFEPVALEACKRYPQNDVEHHHPLRCPVCGSAPALARVGGGNPKQGRQKVLYCQQCGATWEFQRVRCARCGTQNQAHLHYFNVEGDDAHRIGMCDECGSYIRTVFVDDALAPFSFEVEEVVTARLDAIAHDPRFSNERGE